MTSRRATLAGLALLAASSGIRDSVLAEDVVAPTNEALVAQLADPSSWESAARQLVARGTSAVPMLVRGLTDDAVREPVLDVVTELGPLAKDAVPTLGAIVRTHGSPVRPAAARALGAIGADAAAVLDSLVQFLRDDAARNREAAATAIGRILVAQAVATPREAPPLPADDSIPAGCDWLVRHQREDGGWSCGTFADRCASERRCDGGGHPAFDTGVTGLATLALLRATPSASCDATRSGATRGLRSLRSAQDGNGWIGAGTCNAWIYNHMCATLALVEGARSLRGVATRAAASRAVEAVLAAQNPYLGWRYGVRDGDNDTSVTTWGAHVLAEAADAGLVARPSGRLDAAATWVDKLTDPDTGRVGYQRRGGGSSRTNTARERRLGERTEALTACGVLVRVLAGQTQYDAPLVRMGFDRLARLRPRWQAEEIDYYYWAHASWLLSRVGGMDYVEWRKALLATLGSSQRSGAGACAPGSWGACATWGAPRGRGVSTALCVLSLESCAEDPTTRPPLPAEHERVVAALERATAPGEDQDLRRAAGGALDAVRSAYR